jgi:hypothetical protein
LAYRQNFLILPIKIIVKNLHLTLYLFFITLFFSSDANAFREGTTFWYKHASHSELVSHYSKLDIGEICMMWERVGYWKQKRRVPNRNAIKVSLSNKGQDPFLCMKLRSNTAVIYSDNNTGVSSSSYTNNKPKLFYDKSSGGMRECLHNPGITGVCTAFKLFDSTSYDKDTLFYNKQTGAMQPCMGLVTLIGECTAFGLYRSSLASKDQLFYDPSSNKMTTCNHVGIDGKCHMYDIIPRTGSTGGSYRIDSKSNPYYKKVPQTPGALIQSGMDMITGRCTVGLNC